MIDFFNTEKDIQNQKLSVLHSLCFVHHPEKIIKAVQLSVENKYAIETQTEQLMKQVISSKNFAKCSNLKNELKNALNHPFAVEILNLMHTK